MFLRIVFLVFLASNLSASELPRFEEYPADSQYSGVLKRVDLGSHPDARMFRTRLRYNEGKPPNFAGRYIVTLWGCGSSCQVVALIDAKSGKVSFPLEESASSGVCQRSDSRLLVVNPVMAEDVGEYVPEWQKTGYYEWDGTALKLIAESQDAMTQSCDRP